MSIDLKQLKLTAQFCVLAGYPCRRYVNIKGVGYSERPDLTVVMLNPGSAAAKDMVPLNIPCPGGREVEVEWDRTLSRIAALMEAIPSKKMDPGFESFGYPEFE
jgi:hypothetical protein